MKKAIILGSPGSGKSCFAVKLQKLTGLPLIHLDNIWWKADKSHISRPEFDAQLAVILEQESWLIDGDYSRTYEVRIKSCDTAFFLDYSLEQCIDGIKSRVGTIRSDIPWVDEQLDPVLLEKVLEYRQTNRPAVLELVKKHHVPNVVIFKTRQESDEYLAKLDAQPK